MWRNKGGRVSAETEKAIQGVYLALEKLTQFRFYKEEVVLLCKLSDKFKQITDNLKEKATRAEKD